MSDTVLSESISVDLELNSIATLSDDGTRRIVLFATDRVLTPSEADAMRQAWERTFVGWNEPPKFIVIDSTDAEHVFVLKKPADDGEGG